jgi:hypothetical protein
MESAKRSLSQGVVSTLAFALFSLCTRHLLGLLACLGGRGLVLGTEVIAFFVSALPLCLFDPHLGLGGLGVLTWT